jgi:hypothetical protein
MLTKKEVLIEVVASVLFVVFIFAACPLMVIVAGVTLA